MGVAILGEQYLWPGRTIPYAIDPGFRAPDRLAEAVAYWNSTTSIRFVPRTTEADYVLVVREPGVAQCDVGRRRGPQKLLLGDNCTVGSVKHELGHAVGLWHEHCRTDREDWVTIDEAMIKPGRKPDFQIDFICGAKTATRNLGGYDYGSIMHYDPFACSRDKTLPTIIAIRPCPEGLMGQRERLSAGDLAAIELLYAGVPAPRRRP